MRFSSSLVAALLIALASTSAQAQRDAAPPAPRSPSPSPPAVSKPTPVASPPVSPSADPPPLTDAQLDQVAQVVERSIARAMQAQRDQQPPTPSATYPSSQTPVQYAAAQPVTYFASYVQPTTYAASYVQPATPPALTFVNVVVPPSHVQRAFAHVGTKLTALGQPRVRSMALAPTAVPTATATLQVQQVLPQAQVPVQMQALPPPPTVSKVAPVSSSPQSFGLLPR
jgi:hypothetical protein